MFHEGFLIQLRTAWCIKHFIKSYEKVSNFQLKKNTKTRRHLQRDLIQKRPRSVRVTENISTNSDN